MILLAMKNIFMAFLFLLSVNPSVAEDAQESLSAQEEEVERDTFKKAMDILLDQPFAQTAKQTCEAQGKLNKNLRSLCL